MKPAIVFSISSLLCAAAALAGNTSPELSLTTAKPQYTAGQRAKFIATMTPADVSPGFSYFTTAELDGQSVAISQVGAERWETTVEKITAGAHQWQVTLKQMDRKEATAYQQQYFNDLTEIRILQGHLAQPGLSPVQKSQLTAELNEAESALAQIQQSFSAAQSVVESDSVTLAVNPAPSPSPSPSPSQH